MIQEWTESFIQFQVSSAAFWLDIGQARLVLVYNFHRVNTWFRGPILQG